MKQKLKLGLAAVCLTFLTGCSSMGILSELAAPVANFGLGLYNADTYYSKECALYEEVRMSQDTKQWLLQNNPPPIVSEDLAQVAKNNDILVANTYWMYMTLRRLGLKESADALLTDVGDDFHVIENYSYRDLLLLFKERLSESDLLENGGDALQNATIVYGIANRRCLDADIAGAEKLLHSIISSKYWPAFGYLAAEADLTYGRCVEKELS